MNIWAKAGWAEFDSVVAGRESFADWSGLRWVASDVSHLASFEWKPAFKGKQTNVNLQK
jgi:hypothetical protein